MRAFLSSHVLPPREFCALIHAAGFSTAIYRHTRSTVQLLVNSLDVFPSVFLLQQVMNARLHQRRG